MKLAIVGRLQGPVYCQFVYVTAAPESDFRKQTIEVEGSAHGTLS
jgi:hypothetical protein